MGDVVGVALYTKGALVVGTGDITTPDGTTVNPGKDAGILPGDVILSINGTEVEDSDHLTALINGAKEALTASILREGKEGNVTIAPVQDAVDGQYRIGLWVRDSTAGIGTVTYYDENNQAFASLGHAIADADTNTNLLLKEGEIVPAEIVECTKGGGGNPGRVVGHTGYRFRRSGKDREQHRIWAVWQKLSGDGVKRISVWDPGRLAG